MGDIEFRSITVGKFNGEISNAKEQLRLGPRIKYLTAK
jgi:hypothetical protein